MLIVLCLFLLILATGAPIAVALALSSAIVFHFVMDVPLIVVIQKFFTSVDAFSFMAIPFFMLAGSFMSAGGVTRRIVDFCMSLVGTLSGGLALVVSFAGMFFAALSGSSSATTAAIGAAMIEEMEKRGYPVDFAAAVVASSGTVGIVIPPSITMVIYGSIANTSIAALFIGGFFPGIMMGLALCMVSWVIAKKRGYKGTGSFSFAAIAKACRDCFWALLMPLIILGGIYFGIFTPTESAAVAAVYGAFVGFFIYKELKWSDMPKVLLSAVQGTTMIMFVVGAANVFGWIMTASKAPNQMALLFTSMTDDPVMFLMLVNILLLIIGTLVNASTAVIIVTPILLPVALSFGIDPVFFGVLMVVNLAIGAITPPVGLDLFIVSGICGIPVDTVAKKALPYLGALLIVLVILTYCPGIIMFLVNLNP